MTTSHPDNARMLNLGIDVPLKAIGTVRVRELTLEDTLSVAQELMELLAEFTKMEKTSDGMTMFVNLLKNPRLAEAVRKIAALAIGKSANDLKDLGLTDWLKLIKGIKDVFDWDEVRQLFTELIPATQLQSIKDSLTAQKA